jgi:ribosomal protein S12 methylthiotransferase
MHRAYTGAGYLRLIEKLRAARPEISFTTDIIVGFPGETEEDFAQLLEWLEEAQLDRVGCFEYSPVGGAAANSLLEAPVPPEVKQERRARFMELAAEISAQRLARKVGRRMQVLVDRIDGDVAVARSGSDAPEIDGIVRIRGASKMRVGEWAQVRITKAGAYDLEGKPDA